VVEEKTEANYFFEGVISRAKAQAQAVKLRTHILAGQAVGTIVEFVERERPDLLVIG
jgi:nucleotide-binding universal stress UspA family protein